MKSRIVYISILTCVASILSGCDDSVENRYLSTLPYINHDYCYSREWICKKKDISETYFLRKKMQERRFNFVYGKKIKEIRKQIIGKEILFTINPNLNYNIEGVVKIVDVTFSGQAIIEYTLVSKSNNLPEAIYVYIPINESALDVLDPIYLDKEQQNGNSITLRQPLQVTYNTVGWAKFFEGIGFTTKKEHALFEKKAAQDDADDKWRWKDNK